MENKELLKYIYRYALKIKNFQEDRCRQGDVAWDYANEIIKMIEEVENWK